jgi:hypothetical protein
MTNPKHQIPIFKFQTRTTFMHAGKGSQFSRLEFGAWDLFVIWDLDIGI